MKVVIKNIASLVILTLFLVFSCGQSEATVAKKENPTPSFTNTKNAHYSFDPHQDAVAELVDGSLQLIVPILTLEKAIKTANPKIKEWDSYEFRIDANGGEEYGNQEVAFLMVHVKLRDGGQQLLAFDLKPDKDKVFYHINMVTQGNSCTGHCCSKCQWSKKAGSAYYRCWCVIPDTRDECGTNSAGCDHTLTMPKAEVIKKVK